MKSSYYDRCASQYFDETVSLSMDEALSRFLSALPEGSTILDLGCGSGRDSLYFIENGHLVTALDSCKALALKASNHIGQNVLVQDFRSMSLPTKFDGIWACASLLHLPKQDMLAVLQCLRGYLVRNGRFYASFKAKDAEQGFAG